MRTGLRMCQWIKRIGQRIERPDGRPSGRIKRMNAVDVSSRLSYGSVWTPGLIYTSLSICLAEEHEPVQQ